MISPYSNYCFNVNITQKNDTIYQTSGNGVKKQIRLIASTNSNAFYWSLVFYPTWIFFPHSSSNKLSVSAILFYLDRSIMMVKKKRKKKDIPFTLKSCCNTCSFSNLSCWEWLTSGVTRDNSRLFAQVIKAAVGQNSRRAQLGIPWPSHGYLIIQTTLNQKCGAPPQGMPTFRTHMNVAFTV